MSVPRVFAWSLGVTALAAAGDLLFDGNYMYLRRKPPGGSLRNVISVTITELEPQGDQIRVRTADLSADVTVAAVAELDLAPQTPVVFGVKASEVAIYRA